MKKLISILAVALALTMGATAMAATPDTSKIDSRISKLQQDQQRIEQRLQENQAKAAKLSAKEAYNTFRQALLADRATLLSYEDKNLQIRDQNKTLRLSMANAMKTIKENGITLPADTLAALKADNQQISAIWKDIDSTKGQIKAITADNKTAIKNKDYTAMDANFQKIYTLQNWRNDQLTEINGILQQMNTLLTDAISSAPSTGTTAAPTTATTAAAA